MPALETQQDKAAAAEADKKALDEQQKEEETPQEVIRRSIHASAALNVPYLLMNGLATIVASYGLLENSVAVIIGAMIIAVLLGPITGIALALVDGDSKLLRRALLAEFSGAALVLMLSFVIGKIHADISLGSEIVGRTSPSILDLIIALAGGAAGAYATVTPRLSAGLVGVAIATALVPPLCSCGICLAHGLYREGGGAFLLFATNLVAIQSVTSLVFWLSGFHRLARLDQKTVLRSFAPSALLLLALAVFLGRSFQQTLAQETLRSQAEHLLRTEISGSGAATLTELTATSFGDRTLLTAVVRAPWVITPASCARLQGDIRKKTGRSAVDLHIRSVLTRECSDKKFLWGTTGDASASTSSGGSSDKADENAAVSDAPSGLTNP
jgi:uncharacterized hydrophobic protein (TIGR00271 family)